MPYLVTYRYFTDHHERNRTASSDSKFDLKGAFKQYQLDYLKKTHTAFFDEHKRKIWFKEKHSEEFVAKRLELRKAGREGIVEEFLEQLANGKDFSLEYTR